MNIVYGHNAISVFNPLSCGKRKLKRSSLITDLF